MLTLERDEFDRYVVYTNSTSYYYSLAVYAKCSLNAQLDDGAKVAAATLFVHPNARVIYSKGDSRLC